LGQVYDAETPAASPEAKQVKEEIREAAASGKNLLGRVGNQVGHGIRLGTRKALEMVVGWLEPGRSPPGSRGRRGCSPPAAPGAGPALPGGGYGPFATVRPHPAAAQGAPSPPY